ncbi:hypothetical protein HB779_10240 [Phyllobacterium sp. 628]|uniref:hypothetical protein n=1 Tax=Phyllobacterium sp. 628 TaxID=2718938 RepID=UPI0016627072|nr:hypothetical protein [Phyllobacterium sp. 628]QND52247.1 hypothetical protein HB779_10240 [Phyllobacterium sp. 628]
MATIGERRGHAEIIIDGDPHGDVGYRIEVDKIGSTLSASGHIETTHDVLYDAFTSSDVALELKDGSTVQIVIKQFHPSGRGAFVVNGAIPGFRTKPLH